MPTPQTPTHPTQPGQPTQNRPASRTLRQSPAWLLSRVAARGRRLVAEEFERYDLGALHHAVLAMLGESGPSTQADLGRTTRIDLGDLVSVLDELESRAYVVRAPHPSDGRKNLVSLTPSGRRMLRTLTGRADRAYDRLLAPLRSTERRQLVDLLIRVVDPDGSAEPGDSAEPADPVEPVGR